MGIVSWIMPSKGSETRGDGSARDDAVRALKKIGKRRYKRKLDYSKRNAVGSFYSFQE